MPRWIALSFQDSNSSVIRELIWLHDHIISVIFIVILLILYIIIFLLTNRKFYKHLSESTLIETVWSIVPTFLLIVLVLPSIKILYIAEEEKLCESSCKIVAHQWFWDYQSNNPYFSKKNISNSPSKTRYLSTLERTSSLWKNGYPRLLNSSETLQLLKKINTRLLISSTDVIHSFAIPSLAIKVDAVPGRVNQLFCKPNRRGIFFGQCSEICGTYHSFIPIKVKVREVEIK